MPGVDPRSRAASAGPARTFGRGARHHEGAHLNRRGFGADESRVSTASHRIVAEYGLGWDLDKVDWSWPGLIGYRGRGETLELADMSNLRGIYALYSKGSLYYLGLTLAEGIARRLSDHTEDSHAGRWDEFSWFSLDPLTDQQRTYSGLLQRTPGWAGRQRREVRLPIEGAVRDLEAMMIHICKDGVAGLSNIQRPGFVSRAKPWRQLPADQFPCWRQRHQSALARRSSQSA